MATLQSQVISSMPSFPSVSFGKIKYNLQNSKPQASDLSISKYLDEKLSRRNELLTLTTTPAYINMKPKIEKVKTIANTEVLHELYAILEIVADRIEMHTNIGIQRDNWNILLLTSINGMTVTAAIMAGLGAVIGSGGSLLALKLSSCILYMAVTGILMVMNKIQPSQLAEEQRNASRLFKQLYNEIKSSLVFRNLTSDYVNEVMQKVLALDKAYPLPLLGNMLDKFPEKVEPAVWWPQKSQFHEHESVEVNEKRNGWNEKLEEEMKNIVEVVKRKDEADYVRLGKMALKVNKILAFSGPLLTGLAAVGSYLVGMSVCDSWAAFFGVTCGALASVVNTLEHGGQVGMVFEMYRSSAGFYKQMEETIESTLAEKVVGERENGELLEVKVALQLGRNLSELRDLASDLTLPSRIKHKEEFASKLF